MTAKTRLPSAATHLSSEAKRLWKRLNTDFIFGDDQLVVLRVALEAFDRLQEARCTIAEEGATYVSPSSGLVKEHPAVKIEKDARTGFLAALRMLNLHLEA